MNRRLALFVVLAFAGSLLLSLGCAKEEEVGYGGEVQTAPGQAAPGAPGSSKPAGVQVDVNN